MTKKIIALVLALAMCLSLCACGKKPAENNNNVQNTPAPEYVYAAKFSKLSDASDLYMNPRIFTDDGYYMTGYDVIGQNIPEDAEVEYEGQYDVYGVVLYFVDNAGKQTKLENFKRIEVEETDEGRKNFSASSDLAGITLDNEGKLLTIDMVYCSWFDGDDNVELYSDDYWMNMKYSQKYYIRRLDTDGTELSRAAFEVPEESYFDAYNMVCDRAGNAVAIGDGKVMAVAPDGSFAYTIELDGYPDGIVKLNDGRIAIVVYGEQNQQLCIIDEESKSVSETVEAEVNAYSCIPCNNKDSEYDLFYTNGTNVYGLDIEAGKSDLLFNWINCDVNSSSMSKVVARNDGSFVTFLNEYDQNTQKYSVEMVTVSKQPYDSVPQRQAIRLAVLYPDYNIMNAVVKYNRGNEAFRIELDDYSRYNNYDIESGEDAALTKLNTEIMAGNVPDLFLLNGLNYRQLAAKGILEDLYPYIDADSELKREDFFPNVLAALEVNGKLCASVSGFSVQTLMGASSVVGDTPGWTYDELEAALSTMPEGCTVLNEYITKSDILHTCLTLDMTDFVDWGTGKCNFDSEQFIDLLEFVNSFPSEFDWENYRGGESIEERLSQGKQMLAQMSLYSVYDIMYNDYTKSLGDDVTYIGYPTNNGVGNMLQLSESGVAMSSKCANKDAAWGFLRTFFTEEYQTHTWSLPSNRVLFEKKLKDACTIEYQKNRDGKFILDGNGEKIPVAKFSTWDNEKQEYTDVYSMSEEQAEAVRQLVLNTTKLGAYDDSIYGIVVEQAQALFEGQRSAADVAKLVQSKANIFVNEQR